MSETNARTAADGEEVRWQDVLSPEEFAVLRQGGTERPFTGEYVDTTTAGMYQCRACGADLFPSDTKFASHCGWPSFYAPLAEDRVRYIRDTSMGMERIEVSARTATRTSATSSRVRDTTPRLTSATASTRSRRGSTRTPECPISCSSASRS